MKRRNPACRIALIISFATAVFGQTLTSENPFPETGKEGDSATFKQTSTPTVLSGVIVQEISRPEESSPSYLFFRIAVTGPDGRTTNWAIRIYDPSLAAIAQVRTLSLINDYTPEMSKLKAGMAVTVKGFQSSRNGDARLSLIPVSGPGTIAGTLVAKSQ
jgi:hypothetical protein